MKLIVIFGICFLIGVCWSRDQKDEDDEDGGISREYDTSKWKDPHDMFGDDTDTEDVISREYDTSKWKDPHEMFTDDTDTEDNGRNFCPRGGCEDKKVQKDKSEKEKQPKNDENQIEGDQSLTEREEPPNKKESKNEQKYTKKECHADETAYFKHFIRIFSKHMEPLQNEEHKYGAQLMIYDYDYEELKALLKNENSNNKKILDIFSNAFIPLSRSPVALIKSYINLHMIAIGLVAMTLFIVLYLVTRRMFKYPLSIIRNVIVIFFILFVMSVPWEWYRMYQKAFSEKVANSARLVPEVCKPPSKMSPVDSLIIWFKDTFSLADDECIKYHDNILVDPFWEVTPFQAITVCASRFFLEPMKLFSSGMGQCFRLFFKEVPAQWQPLVFFAFCFFVTLLVLTQAGMEIWTPLLRFGVRPRDDRRLDALQADNLRLRDQVEALKVKMERRPVLAVQNNQEVQQQIEEIGVGGVRPRQDANDVYCDYEIVQNRGVHECNRDNRDNQGLQQIWGRDDREPNRGNREPNRGNRENDLGDRHLDRDNRELNRPDNEPNPENRNDLQLNDDSLIDERDSRDIVPNNDDNNDNGNDIIDSRVPNSEENSRPQPIENLANDREDNVENFEFLDRVPQEHEEQLLHQN